MQGLPCWMVPRSRGQTILPPMHSGEWFCFFLIFLFFFTHLSYPYSLFKFVNRASMVDQTAPSAMAAMTVGQDSTPPPPTPWSVWRVILECIKSKEEKQRVSHAFQESTGEQTRRIAATATTVKLARPQLNRVANNRANHLVQAPLFLVAERRQ